MIDSNIQSKPLVSYDSVFEIRRRLGMDNKQPQQQQPTPQQPSTSTQSTPANRDWIEELNKLKKDHNLLKNQHETSKINIINAQILPGQLDDIMFFKHINYDMYIINSLPFPFDNLYEDSEFNTFIHNFEWTNP